MIPPSRAPGTALRGRYLVQNRAWNTALQLTDAVLARVAHATHASIVAPPRRILVAVGGQLGDAVIATGVLPVLAGLFPSAELGMLLPSWSRAVVTGHPLLARTHHADHWKLSRTPAGRLRKWSAYRTSAAAAVRELRAENYDVAIDLYAYYPNSSWLLWRAGIPVRVGYTSGGCGPLYTRAIDWSASLGHTARQHLRLVHEIAPAHTATRIAESAPRYDLPPLQELAIARARELVGGRYVVVHPGTGDPKKAWPLEQWRALIARLAQRGDRVVLTGAGDRERSVADTLVHSGANVLNLVGALDWPTFRVVLANAAAAIGPDSVAMHVAAAEGTPAVVLMAAISDPAQWRPLGDRVAALTHAVPCAPCFRKDGCAEMTCVREVSVDETLAALDELLGIGEATSA